MIGVALKEVPSKPVYLSECDRNSSTKMKENDDEEEEDRNSKVSE
jgi:hypothetical protein